MGYKPIPLDLIAGLRDKGLTCSKIVETIFIVTGRRFRPESVSAAICAARKNGDDRFPILKPRMPR